jgi:hypothetical protein
VNEVYLGDGLYASFDGYQIMLRAPRAGGDHYVALEPAVWQKLLRFEQSLREPAGPAEQEAPQ